MWKHLTIEAFLGFLRNHVSTFLSPLIKVSPHCTLPSKLQALIQLHYPIWNTPGQICAYAVPGGWAESQRFGALLNQMLRLSFCVHMLLHHDEQRSLTEENGIAANVIPLREYFPTHSACSHPAGKVWEISEGGQRRVNLISLCSSASANCRREGRV